ncbi:hypothetical protein EJB05_51126, partial [Eragrostis curvula]
LPALSETPHPPLSHFRSPRGRFGAEASSINSKGTASSQPSPSLTLLLAFSAGTRQPGSASARPRCRHTTPATRRCSTPEPNVSIQKRPCDGVSLSKIMNRSVVNREESQRRQRDFAVQGQDTVMGNRYSHRVTRLQEQGSASELNRRYNTLTTNNIIEDGGAAHSLVLANPEAHKMSQTSLELPMSQSRNVYQSNFSGSIYGGKLTNLERSQVRGTAYSFMATDDLPPPYTNSRSMKDGGCASGNEDFTIPVKRSAPKAILPESSNAMAPTDMEAQIHQHEREAYCSVLRAFQSQSDIMTWGRKISGGSAVKYMPSSSGTSGRRKHMNIYFAGDPAAVVSQAQSMNSLIGREILIRWPDHNGFYEAVISDYNRETVCCLSNPMYSFVSSLQLCLRVSVQGLYALVYDNNTSNVTREWVDLTKVGPEDIRWLKSGIDPMTYYLQSQGA